MQESQSGSQQEKNSEAAPRYVIRISELLSKNREITYDVHSASYVVSPRFLLRNFEPVAELSSLTTTPIYVTFLNSSRIDQESEFHEFDPSSRYFCFDISVPSNESMYIETVLKPFFPSFFLTIKNDFSSRNIIIVAKKKSIKTLFSSRITVRKDAFKAWLTVQSLVAETFEGFDTLFSENERHDVDVVPLFNGDLRLYPPPMVFENCPQYEPAKSSDRLRRIAGLRTVYTFNVDDEHGIKRYEP